MSLKQNIASLAETFATEVLKTMQGASLQDLYALNDDGPPSGTRTRTKGAAKVSSRPKGGPINADQIAKDIVAHVKKFAAGISGEEIRKALKLDKNSWSKGAGKALADKGIRKTGAKRSTKYYPPKAA